MMFKRFAVLVMVALLLAVLSTGCSSGGPVGTVKAFINAGFSGDLKKAEKYLVEELRTGLDEMGFMAGIMDIPGMKDMMKEMAKNTKYKLISDDGSKAKVMVSIDLGKALGPLGSMMGEESVQETTYTLENQGGKWLISDMG